MKVEELQAGFNIILHVDIGGKTGDFPSKVIDANEKGIFAEPIRINNKVLGFSGENVKLSMSYISGESSPVFWRGVTCQTILKDGKTVYSISSPNEGFEQNRREAFRVFVGANGVTQLGINTKALDVIVKDVSETGFSFVSEVDLENAINVPVRLVFNDMEQDFSIMGIVVRKVVIDEKKILYGCKLSVESAQLSRYINQKQRQQMSLNREDTLNKTKQAMVKSLQEGTSAGAHNKRTNNIGFNINKNRDIGEVDKDERRKVFRNAQYGKRV